MAESVTNQPWNGAASRFTDEQYARSCLLDRGPDAGSAKQRYSIPVREPSGTLNRNACHAAAGGRGISAASASAEQKRSAARKLVRLYRGPLDEEPPDSLLALAGMGKATKSEDGIVEIKRFGVSEVKALDSEAPGTFEALVSVFGNVDLVDDIVEPGAFDDSLEKSLPAIVWSHDWDTPPIGAPLEAKETDKGLYVKGRLFVGEGEDHSLARQVYTAMKARDGRGQPVLREFSFGYGEPEAEFSDRDGKKIRHLKKIPLIEVGPCLKGVNEATQLLTIKSALDRELKAGRVLSTANEARLRDAAQMISDVLSTLADKSATPELEQASPAHPQEPEDKDPPNPEAGEEADPRIAQLLLARPIHVP